MKTLLGLITITLIISGCSGHRTVNKPIDLSLLDAKKLERAQNLYSCSSFFNIFTSARAHRNDPPESTNLTIEMASTASELANKILHEAAEGKELELNSLVSTLVRKGADEAFNMVREIGASSDPNKKNDLFLSCYKDIQREKFFDTVDVLNKALAKPGE